MMYNKKTKITKIYEVIETNFVVHPSIFFTKYESGIREKFLFVFRYKRKVFIYYSKSNWN